jgi:hypothetical protein
MEMFRLQQSIQLIQQQSETDAQKYESAMQELLQQLEEQSGDITQLELQINVLKEEKKQFGKKERRRERERKRVCVRVDVFCSLILSFIFPLEQQVFEERTLVIQKQKSLDATIDELKEENGIYQQQLEQTKKELES